jgi:glycosyltransferase involved in cell wall biosynthesis
MDDSRSPKVCVVCQNASFKYGGEAGLPWLLFKFLRRRGVDAHLVAHGRTKPEVLAGFPEDIDRLHFIPETRFDRFLHKCGSYLPGKIDAQTFGTARHIFNQMLQRKIVKRLVEEKGIEIVHEINPVSPKQISAMFGLNVPVVIGPLAGGMLYPPAFSFMDSKAARAVEAFGRATSLVLNFLVPGKLLADALIVANGQGKDALPVGTLGAIHHVPDVGVDLNVWTARDDAAPRPSGPVRFVYLGRLADWKGVQFLLPAFKQVLSQMDNVTLDILGSGEDQAKLQSQAGELNFGDKLNFVGWVSAAEGARRLREADVLVLPSLHEVGGIVILEAMAVGLPVIATNWGGPAVHVTDETGIRVNPASKEKFISGLADAMLRLARSPDLRQQMGRAGRAHVTTNLYDWSQKTDRLLQIYRELIDRRN